MSKLRRLAPVTQEPRKPRLCCDRGSFGRRLSRTECQVPSVNHDHFGMNNAHKVSRSIFLYFPGPPPAIPTAP